MELLKFYAHLSERVAMNITLTVDCVNACLTNVPEIDELGRLLATDKEKDVMAKYLKSSHDFLVSARETRQRP